MGSGAIRMPGTSFRRAGGGPMVRQLYLRIVSALGLVALAALFVGIDPFLSAGASLSSQTPAVSVNRALKGDRLPFACAPAVSLIRSPNSAPVSLANVYRRCMA